MGRRVLVGGSGPLLLPVAAGLAEAGVRVVAVLEAAPAHAALPQAQLAAYPSQLQETADCAAVLARHRVPLHTGYAVIACQGTDRVERAVIARLDRDWRPLPGSQREETVDAVHVSFGFSPVLELPRALGCADVQHASRPTAAVACDAQHGHVGNGGVRRRRGDRGQRRRRGRAGGLPGGRVGARSWAGCTRTRTRRTPGRSGPLENARQLAARLDEAYPLRPGWLQWPDAGTVACRCEETHWAEIGAAVAGGARDVRAVREVTGCGMGYCRGRVCGPALQFAVSAASGRSLAEVGDLHTGR